MEKTWTFKSAIEYMTIKQYFNRFTDNESTDLEIGGKKKCRVKMNPKDASVLPQCVSLLTHFSASGTGHLKAADGVERSNLPPADTSGEEQQAQSKTVHLCSAVNCLRVILELK